MDKLRKSFRSSFRKKYGEDTPTEGGKGWPEDEREVKANTCSFEVRYLGAVEVFESRGMSVCEEALKLMASNKRSTIKGCLHISGDGLRVVETGTKGLVLDQTIEKVSFCAPDRNYEKGFSYICRDGTTRRWMCHGFMALKETGERLSHAVGCAFAICLEKKQKREKECAVKMVTDERGVTFTRCGSFSQGSVYDRLQDPQIFKPLPQPLGVASDSVCNPDAIARPRASELMFQRQASFKGLAQLSGTSPFKRQASLILQELPSYAATTCSPIREDVPELSGPVSLPTHLMPDLSGPASLPAHIHPSSPSNSPTHSAVSEESQNPWDQVPDQPSLQPSPLPSRSLVPPFSLAPAPALSTVDSQTPHSLPIDLWLNHNEDQELSTEILEPERKPMISVHRPTDSTKPPTTIPKENSQEKDDFRLVHLKDSLQSKLINASQEPLVEGHFMSNRSGQDLPHPLPQKCYVPETNPWAAQAIEARNTLKNTNPFLEAKKETVNQRI